MLNYRAAFAQIANVIGEDDDSSSESGHPIFGHVLVGNDPSLFIKRERERARER